jgi:hypothetical protein
METNEIKFILGDLQQIISFNLSNKTSKEIICESLLYDIIFFIEDKIAYNQDKTSNGVVIYVDDFLYKFKLSKLVINRHINWLIDNTIIWRSKLEYTNDVRLPHRYDINWDIKITGLTRFIYTTYKEYNKLQDETTLVRNITESNIYSNLNNVSIDWEKALNTIYNSDMKIKGKKDQSYYIYQIAFNKYKVSQKSSDKRIYHNITNLSSKIHNSLYINNIPVSEIDAKQSQLVLLGLLTKDIDYTFFNAVTTTYIYDDIIKYAIDKLNRESLTLDKQQYLQYYCSDEHKTNYIHPNKIDKNIIKPLVYASIFSGFNTKNYNIVTEYFTIKFPKLVEYIKTTYKKEDSLSNTLQKFEASIWVTVFNKLSKNKIITVIKHDALLFKYYDVQVILDELIHQYGLKGLKIDKYNYTKYLELKIVKPETKELFKPTKPNFVILDNFRETYSEIQSEIQSEIVQPNTDQTIYTFLNKNGETFTGIKSKFTSQMNLDKSAVNKVINGKEKSVKGWSLA